METVWRQTRPGHDRWRERPRVATPSRAARKAPVVSADPGACSRTAGGWRSPASAAQQQPPWRQPPWWLTCGPQRRAGLGQGGWPEGLRARPDQRRHHAAVRRGLLGRNLRDLGCAERALACADAGSGGLAGWVLLVSGGRVGRARPGSSKTRRWTGVWTVSFSGSRPAEADGLAGEGGKVVEQVAVVADG